MWHSRFAGIVVLLAMQIPGLQLHAQDAPAASRGANATNKRSVEDSADSALQDRSKDRAAIQASADTFAEAYNAHDAKALSELFLPAGQIIDADDNTIDGREQIVDVFSGVFENAPETKIEVSIDSIRFVGASLAVEYGTTTTSYTPDSLPEHGRYSALHVLKDGKWMMGIVHELPAEPTHRDHLQSLSWLVGDWVDENHEGIVKTSCRWADNESFLLQEITVHRSGQNIMKVNQRIGWDALTGRFRAWVFDSEGGYGESWWTPTETGWLIKATAVHSDGTTSSATNHIEPTDLNRYIFRSVDRIVGNEVIPPVEIHVVRQAPPPSE